MAVEFCTVMSCRASKIAQKVTLVLDKECIRSSNTLPAGVEADGTRQEHALGVSIRMLATITKEESEVRDNTVVRVF